MLERLTDEQIDELSDYALILLERNDEHEED
jgi:hypothetical protein